MTIGLWITALGLGIRHGIDWDHIAAIADLSTTAESRKRGFWLSFLYAVGHGLVVIALGSLAILFGASLPEGVDVWMGRVVGLTLVVLGAWVLIELARKGRDFRLRSRWILVLGGTFAGLRRVRQASARRKLRVEHDHDHPHATIVDDSLDDALPHDDPLAHDHAHAIAEESVIDLTVGAEAQPATSGSRRWPSRAHSHSHRHHHETELVASAGTGNGTAAGIGVLHGIGFESPTQIAIFVASTSVVGVTAGFGLLVAWVLGLIVANSILAVLAAYGLLGAERNFTIYATVAVLVGIISLVMGTLLLLGIDDVLPALLI